MRKNEQGEKVACSKCRVGHRTSKCVNKPGHQNGVQVIRSQGRPIGAKTNDVRAAERRKKLSRPQTKVQLGKQGAADLQPHAHTFCPGYAAAGPVQGRSAAEYQQLPVAGYQNPGSFMNPPALVPSTAQPPSSLPDPLNVGLPAAVRHPLEYPAYLGMGFGPAPPLPAVPAPIFASSAPVSQPVVANQFGAMPQNVMVNNSFMEFSQVDMTAQAQQGGNMVIQTLPGDLMGAGNIAPSVPPVPFVSPPNLSPSNEEASGVIPWDDGFSPEQPVQPTPVANSDAQSPGSPSSSGSFSFLDLLRSDGYFPWELPAHGTQAGQGASAPSGQDTFVDVSFPVADPSTGADLYDPGEESGFPVKTAGDFFQFSYNLI
ncbi:hypothetical protein FCOIX_8060 [Fusarium coicis]|nr:hypothetical protein FCOIX_8060 [Fusarium coicis]